MKCAVEAKAFAFASGFLQNQNFPQFENSANNSDRKYTSQVAAERKIQQFNLYTKNIITNFGSY
ncbi:hypothetical protein J41TS12_39000 [Paenibacillus antibioticophila]|uniref:Uncharacterized protein n=1 Tax=Paenibacillus antibioticophila TaxID=1274374 RepID=A0A920CJ56_9BACL|nr:hypothetical protein J41TS12_39000 [Paenibacillus antibioticophila]